MEKDVERSIQKIKFLREALKRQATVDPEAAEKSLTILENMINEIYICNATSLSFEELYSNASFLVGNKCGEMLYSRIVSTITSHIKEMATCVEASNEPLFLEELNRKWMEHHKAFDILSCIFMSMNQSCTPSTHKAHVLELGIQLWVDNIIYSSNIQIRLKDTLQEIVQRERDGKIINTDLMQNIMKMLMDLGPSVYQEMFEKPFLSLSTKLYREESQQLIECCDCGDYLKKAEKCLNEEMERISDYLVPKNLVDSTDMEEVESPPGLVDHSGLIAKSVMKITNVVEKEMIENQMSRLVNLGLVSMIVDDKYDDLARMYNLFRRVPNGLTLIRDMMACHIQETCKQLVTDPEWFKDHPVDFVQRLLDEKDKHYKIISLSFNGDVSFENELNFSFEYFINSNPLFPEFISLFMDDKLRKGVNDVDVDIVLDKAITLFGYLHEKDVFEKYYRRHLIKRLISGEIVYENAEKSLISKLNTECGTLFTSQMEDMLTKIQSRLACFSSSGL